MGFKMSLRAKIEEGFVEVNCICGRYVDEVRKIVRALHRSEQLDMENDAVRLEVRTHLVEALNENRKRNINEVCKRLNAAIQLLAKQEELDLADDKPRRDAVANLLFLQNKMIRAQQEIRRYTGMLQKARIEEAVRDNSPVEEVY